MRKNEYFDDKLEFFYRHKVPFNLVLDSAF